MNEQRLAHLSVGNPPKEGLLIYKNINRNVRKFFGLIEGKLTWLEFLNMAAHQLHVNYLNRLVFTLKTYLKYIFTNKLLQYFIIDLYLTCI